MKKDKRFGNTASLTTSRSSTLGFDWLYILLVIIIVTGYKRNHR